MASKLVRGLVERPVALPLQSALEEKGAKFYHSEELKTFFSGYKIPIGIEVEVEGFSQEKWPQKCIYWNLDKDGSLKDHGAELISTPVAGKNIDYALRELANGMKDQRPRWSHRCSVHIHINVRAWSFEQLRSLIGLYAVFENLFFSLVPEDRRANGFAYPLTDIMPQDVRFGWDEGKYCALNVGSCIAKFGTVEFRHMAGTADPITLRRWIQLIVKLHSYVKKQGAEAVERTVTGLNTNSEYQALLTNVFGATAQIFPPTVLQNSMEEGVLWSKIYFAERN